MKLFLFLLISFIFARFEDRLTRFSTLEKVYIENQKNFWIKQFKPFEKNGFKEEAILGAK